jgi:hypothetical protein
MELHIRYIHSINITEVVYTATAALKHVSASLGQKL